MATWSVIQGDLKSVNKQATNVKEKRERLETPNFIEANKIASTDFAG